MSVAAITETVQYLTFKLAEEIFAIDVSKVREILEFTTITKVPQQFAEAITGWTSNKYVILLILNVLFLVLGFFLPPVSIILMTAPIILPPLKDAGFDLIWFGIVMTVVMEMGLIHPPVGLNIFVIKNVAPDIPLKDIVWGVMPFLGLMFLAVILLCLFPGIATWLPDLVMGAAT